MFIPIWVIVLIVVVMGGWVFWSLAVVRGRNPLPFPDGGSRIFTAASPEGKEAIVALLDWHGLKARFQADSGGVLRSIFWDGTIINHPTSEVHQRLGFAAASIGLVVRNPDKAAQSAVAFLRERGFQAEVVSNVEVGLPIAFVTTDAMVGTVLSFRKSMIHMPKPSPA